MLEYNIWPIFFFRKWNLFELQEENWYCLKLPENTALWLQRSYHWEMKFSTIYIYQKGILFRKSMSKYRGTVFFKIIF